MTSPQIISHIILERNDGARVTIPLPTAIVIEPGYRIRDISGVNAKTSEIMEALDRSFASLQQKKREEDDLKAVHELQGKVIRAACAFTALNPPAFSLSDLSELNEKLDQIGDECLEKYKNLEDAVDQLIGRTIPEVSTSVSSQS